VELGEIDGKPQTIARRDPRARVEAGDERPGQLDGTLAELDGLDPWDAEVGERLGPELLCHFHLGRERDPRLGTGQPGILEGLRTQADQHLGGTVPDPPAELSGSSRQ